MTTTLPHLTFGGILRSEWIKLRSLRSTFWCYSILVFLTVGLGLLFAATFSGMGEMDYDTQQTFAVQAATLSLGMSQLVVCVLGALVITGEYGTGMIRSTLTAVPTRLPALAAKALVFAAVTFVISLVSIVLTMLISAPLLAGNGIEVDLGSAAVWLPLVGAAGYLALIGVLAFSLGTIIRHSAGGIAAVLGLILVVPTIVSVFAVITRAEWVANAQNFLPSNAGARMYAYVSDAAAAVDPMGLNATPLEPWQGALVVVAWVAALLVLAGVLLKRRDA